MTKLKTSHMEGKCSTTEPYSYPIIKRNFKRFDTVKKVNLFFASKKQIYSKRNSRVGKVFALHGANLGSIQGIAYGSLNPAGIIPVHRVNSKP